MKPNRNMLDLGHRRGRKSELEGREGAVVGTLDSPLIPWMGIEGGREGQWGLSWANGELNTMPMQFCNIILAAETEQGEGYHGAHCLTDCLCSLLGEGKGESVSILVHAL